MTQNSFSRQRPKTRIQAVEHTGSMLIPAELSKLGYPLKSAGDGEFIVIPASEFQHPHLTKELFEKTINQLDKGNLEALSCQILDRLGETPLTIGSTSWDDTSTISIPTVLGPLLRQTETIAEKLAFPPESKLEIQIFRPIEAAQTPHLDPARTSGYFASRSITIVYTLEPGTKHYDYPFTKGTPGDIKGERFNEISGDTLHTLAYQAVYLKDADLEHSFQVEPGDILVTDEALPSFHTSDPDRTWIIHISITERYATAQEIELFRTRYPDHKIPRNVHNRWLRPARYRI